MTGGSAAWIDYVAPALLLLGLVLVVWGVWFAVWSISRWARGGDDPGPDDGGGGMGEGNPTPPAHSPDSEPEWWPEFEREFAYYVRRRLTQSG